VLGELPELLPAQARGTAAAQTQAHRPPQSLQITEGYNPWMKEYYRIAPPPQILFRLNADPDPAISLNADPDPSYAVTLKVIFYIFTIFFSNSHLFYILYISVKLTCNM
jgi:hypothetical protein